MVKASTRRSGHLQFEGASNSGHRVVLDGEAKVASSPTELVLVALCGCTAYDIVSILQKKREPLESLEVSAEAEKASSPPRVYTAIQLTYRVRGAVSRKAVEDAVRLSKDNYCSVSAMLKCTAQITYRLELDSK